MSSFEDSFAKDAEEFGFNSGNADEGGFFKVKDGVNKIRVLTEPKIVVSRYGYGVCYEGCGYCTKEALDKARAEGKQANLTYRYMSWIYDHEGKRVVLYSMPLTIAKAIVALKRDEAGEGYAFSEFPMPYNLSIIVKNAGTMDVEYTIQAARENTEVPEKILALLEKESTVEQIIEKMKDKQRKKDMIPDLNRAVEEAYDDAPIGEIPF